MAKKQTSKKPSSKNAPKERIPEGMTRAEYADAAFKKKVTMIMGSILLVFIIGVVAVLINGWVQTDRHNKEFEAAEQAFQAETERVLKELEEIDANGGTLEDRAAVKINVTDENFSDWVATLDATYQISEGEEGRGAYQGATVNMEGMFFKRVFEGGYTEYWVYRLHSHDGEEHEHSDDEDVSALINEMVPMEVIFADENAEIPEDGTWVSVTGIVGVSSSNSTSAIRNVELTVLDEPGQEYVE